MKKIILLTLVCCSINALAQEPAYKKMMHDNSINFYTVCKEAENYFSTIDIHKKGSGWKPFQRWKEANEYKYFPGGDRSNVDPYFVSKQYKTFLNQYGNAQNKLFSSGWNEVGPSTIDSLTGHYSAGLGRIEDVHVAPSNPNTIYIGSRSGGLWKTTDGGQNWISAGTDFLFASGVNTVTASPTNPDSVLINVRNAQNGISHGIYRSINGGTAWTLSNFNPTNVGFGGLGSYFVIYEIAYHPRVPNLIFIATNEGIYRSNNNLQSWTQLYSPNNFTDIAFHPTDDDVLYVYNASNPNVILRSTDQGLSYTNSATLTGNNNTTNLEISTSGDCPDCVYAATTNGVWKSTDQGQSFTFMSNPGQTCRGFAVNDLDTSKMIYGYVDLEQSTDGGQSFNRVTRWSLGNTNGSGNGNQVSYNTSTDYIHADVRNAKCLNGVFYVTTDGFLSKSTDNGITWQKLSNGVGIRENYRLGVSQSNHYKVVCGSQDNGTSFSIQDGWVEFYGADGMEALVHPLNEDWFMGSVQYGNRRRTTNGGRSQGGGSPAGSNAADWIAPLAYNPNNHMEVFDFRDSIYKSDDFGDNHITLSKPLSFSGNIKNARIAENNSDIIVVARNASIDKSTDGGLTWNTIRGNLPAYTIQDIAFDPNNDDVIIVVYARYQADNNKVYMTTTGGTTWTNITNNLGNMPIRSVVIDHTNASNIYLGAEIGVYTMPMGGNSWSLYNSGLPNMSVRELNINYGSNTLKAATWGRGLWEYNLVGRNDYPAIVHTDITSTPTMDKPKYNVDQLVTSRIAYDNTLSAVYLEWSINTPTFGNLITMTNTVDSTWVSTSPLPNVAVGTKLFFKVFAVGQNNDTTETYKFMYTQQPFAYCIATGHDDDGNLFIENVTMDVINNTTTNDAYTNYTTPIATLHADSSYNLDVTANTGWAENDYGAWIDFNKDAEFTDNERVLWSIGPNVNNVNNTFTVPSSVINNDTVQMRVRLSYWGSEPRSCGTQFGEVEDYTVVLKSSNAPLGIENISNTIEASIYPNPTSGILHIDFKESKKRNFSIKSQIGQIIRSGTLYQQDNTIDLEDLTAGIYYLQIDQSVFKVLKRD